MASKQQRELLQTLNKFYQNPVAKISLELFLSVAAVIFFAVFAIRPTLLIMSDLIKEIEDKEKLDNQLQQKIAALSSAQSEYQIIKHRLEVLDVAVPNQPMILYSFKILEKVASDNQVIIQSVSLNEIPPEEPIALQEATLKRNDLLFKIVVAGNYLTIKNFAHMLKQSQRVFNIQNIAFNVEDNRGAKNLEATFTINIPYYGAKQETEGARL